jgi:MoxR-like ATPase
MLKPEKLQFWLEKKYNVLLEGKHGVGKTALVLQAFEKAGLSYAYFSGSTMDPFIDFCGVPIRIEGPEGSYIELIRPRHLVERPIQAIFIDEFNRTHKKIRNAVMELIQFKTINGKLFSPDLRVVWAAINPDSTDDGIYDTDRLDPAQKDRFHVQVQLPYECDYSYFADKYTDVIAKSALQYWNDLPQNQKDLISPRRLDYALQVWSDGGDVRDVLDTTCNASRLINILAVGPAEIKLQQLFGKDEEARRFLSNENNYSYALKTIMGSPKFMAFYLPLMMNEKITSLYTQEPKVKKFILEDIKGKGKESLFVKPLAEIAIANQNAAISQQIREELDKVGIIAAPGQIQVFFYNNVTTNEVSVNALLNTKSSATYNRAKVYKDLEKNVGATMSPDAAKAVISVINKLSAALQSTIKRDMGNIYKIGNFAILQMLKGGMAQADVEKFVNSMRKFKRRRAENMAPSVVDIARFLRAQSAPQNVVKLSA